MAKDIRECLLEQARKFHQWQEITYPGKTTEEIGGAWEVDYPAWNDIFDAFCHVLTQMNAEMADSVLLDEMVYLIARANEAEGFIQETTSHPQWFECLCRRAAASNENEAKWQFAAYLPECSCSQKVRDIILDFAKDPNEYVSRRALLAMPALRPDCVEQFAPLFWERNCYSPELQEYQRIAVLISLDAIHSDQLPQYLEWAKQDGQSYLLEHAKRIEGGLSMNEKLSRPQFNQMDTTEKQALMESLAARYDMTFLGLHTFDRWGQSCAMLLVAACRTYGEPVPPTVEKDWNFGEHPLVARLASDEERVWSLLRGATWWLPLADAFFFQAPLPTDDQAMIATLGGLRKELEKLNQLAWQADEDTILGWADTEGYPVDGTLGPDGQYSKADIPERTQYDTQSLAKFAFSMFWHAMRFAEEQQVPILLDY